MIQLAAAAAATLAAVGGGGGLRVFLLGCVGRFDPQPASKKIIPTPTSTHTHIHKHARTHRPRRPRPRLAGRDDERAGRPHRHQSDGHGHCCSSCCCCGPHASGCCVSVGVVVGLHEHERDDG